MLSSPITIELVSVRLYTEGKEVRVYYDATRVTYAPVVVTDFRGGLYTMGAFYRVRRFNLYPILPST